MDVVRLLRRPEVEKIVGLSRSAIYDAMDKGRFPRPVQIGRRAVAWRSDVISQWLDNRPVSYGW